MPIEDAQVRTMATLTLEYGPAIQQSLKFAKAVKDQELELAKLQARLTDLSKAAAKGISVPDLTTVKTSVTQMQQMVTSGQKLGEEDLTRLATAKRFVDLQTPLVAVQTKQLDIAKQTNAELKKGETFFERRFGWFAAGSLFYGTLQAAKDIVQNMKDIESAMVTIERVSQEPLANFAEMQKELLRLGVEYGRTWNTVSDIAIKWAQAGYSMKETLELTRVSLLALNTAELDSAQATQGMIAIMSQWGLTADQLLPSLDMINRTADSYAVSSADLIDGLSRSSGAAKMLGMSIEETIGLLTVLRESSGRTGREVGNALNSILAFMQRPGAIKAMEGAGIDVWQDAAHTQMRNVMEIFSDIASRWPSLTRQMQDSFATVAEQAGLYSQEIADIVTKTDEFTQAQQREIATADAGTYRRNFFMALMANFGKVLGVVTNMENSLGYSEAENAKRMETYEAKVYQLKAAWESFADIFAQTGLLEQLKAFTDVGTGVLGFFNNLPAPMKAATGMMVEYAAALTLARLAQKTFHIAGFDMFETLGNIGSRHNWKWLENLGIAGLGITGWQVAGATALVVGIISLIKQQREYNQALGEAAGYYREASESGKDMSNVIQEIGNRYPELVTQIDEHGRVLAIDTQRLAEHDQALRNTFSPLDELKKKYRDVTQELAALNEELLDLSGQGQYTENFLPDEGLAPTMPVPDDTRQQQIIRRMIELGKTEAEIAAELNKRGNTAGATPSETGLSPDLENAKSRYDSATQSALSLDLALIRVRKSLSLVDAEEKSLGDTLEDATRREELAAQKARLLADENYLLGESNKDLTGRLAVLNDLMGQAETAISTLGKGTEKDNWLSFQKSLTSEIRSTTQELADNTVAIRENEIAIEHSSDEVKEYYKKAAEEAKKSYSEIYSLSKSTFEHQVRMLNTTLDLQIRYYRKLYDLYKDDQEKRWDIEEKLQGLYRDALEDQVDNVKDAYDEQIDALRSRMDREIKIRQDQIDALDQLEKGSDRSEAARQHSQKIKEIEEKLAYERLRTGIEHERNIIQLEKDKAEELIRWQRQQEEWSRDDRRDALQNEIDDIRESYEDRQRELEDAWKKAEKFLTSEFVTILSTAAVYDSKWYEQGKTWAAQLTAGIKDGINASELNSLIAVLSGKVSGAPTQSNLLASSQALLDAKREWEAAFARGDEAGMKAAAARGASIRASSPTLDPDMKLTGDELEAAIKRSSFDTGGKALTRGWAVLDPGELVLKANLTQNLERLLGNMGSASMSTVYNLNSPLVTFPNLQVTDRADADYIISTVDRHVKRLLTGKGVITRGAVV